MRSRSRLPRIGVVSATAGSQISTPTLDGFREGLRELGYSDGKNIILEYRYAEGKQERVPSFIAEFVQLNVDLILVGSSAGIRAAKHATNTIPIVMVSVVDPVATGTVDSLARPGRNITGLAILTRELSGKRLELLKEVIPSLRRIGIFWHKESPSSVVGFKEYTSVAEALKLELHSFEVQGSNPDFSPAFQAAVKQKVAAVITIGSPVLNSHPKQIAELALQNRLPSMYERNRYVEAAGLMSYGSNEREDWRRAAVYVDKILKGAKPADLPVEQPTKFEFVINLRTAKQIGLTIPPNVLARADRVIR
jgi:putative ABC transport system substrate-binding protein